MQRDLKQLDEQILELMKERVAKTNSEHVSEIEQLTKQLDLIASTVSRHWGDSIQNTASLHHFP